jgi:hypothetical protein
MQTLNSGPLGGPVSGSGVLDDPVSRIVDSIMCSDVSRGAATDALDATSTQCSNTFFLMPPRSMSPPNGYHVHPDSRDLDGLTDELLDNEAYKVSGVDTGRHGQPLRRMSQELKERSKQTEDG